MFRAVIRAAALNEVVSSLSSVLKVINMECSENGIRMQRTNQENTLYFDANIRVDDFAEYRCRAKCSLGINLESLKKILKIAKSTGNVTLEYERGGIELNLLVVHKGTDKIAGFELTLITVDVQDNNDMPQFNYTNIVQLKDQSEMLNILKQLKLFDKKMMLTSSNQGLKFEVEEDQMTKVTKEIKCLGDAGNKEGNRLLGYNILHMQVGGNIVKTFNFLGLEKILAQLPKTTVTVHMGDDTPIFFEILKLANYRLKIYIAPDVEDEFSEAHRDNPQPRELDLWGDFDDHDLLMAVDEVERHDGQ